MIIQGLMVQKIPNTFAIESRILFLYCIFLQVESRIDWNLADALDFS